ncbi:MAG: hypothetical protein GXX90_08110 [Microbacteriaceae bacterium]|nr:hypothetical protein [Microbacteriaceae bacterium]
MTWTLHDGLPVLGAPLDLAPPLVAAVEARGAVLEWPFDAPAGATPTITVTDPLEADWLWRLVGERAHAALHAPAADAPAIADRADAEPAGASAVDAAAPDWDAPLVLALRRLAHGLWARAWWPTSPHDGIAPLERAVLDAELRELAESLEGIVDADALPRLAGGSDDDRPPAASPRRADYALAAAGRDDEEVAAPIAAGESPVAWQGVPAGTIDATELPVRWSVDAAPAPHLRLVVRLAHAGADCAGLPVAVELDGMRLATGALDERGRAELELPLTAAEAWAADWSAMRVRVGAEVDEPAELRHRIRAFARARRGADDPLALRAEADDDY